MTVETPGLGEAFKTDFHAVMPKTAYVFDGARKDLGERSRMGMAVFGLGAAATAIYSAGTVVEAGLVGAGAYFGHKYGWLAGGTTQATLSGLVETAMGVMTYVGIKHMPHAIANHAEVKYKEDVHVTKQYARKLGRYAAIGAFLGTPGIMIDSVARQPERSLAVHARNGAIAMGAFAAVNFGVGSGVTKAIEGATSDWMKDKWHAGAEWLREHHTGGVATGISKVGNLIADAATFTADHVPLVAGGAVVLGGGYAYYKLGRHFINAKQAIKARLSPEPRQ
ncbi:MAG TPA: hypothetical protein VLF43_03320 [Candidatus Saccharimonadales bacterium]|nr:hypothetical protein [Candidatus Saccharimonadales bacterium]